MDFRPGSISYAGHMAHERCPECGKLDPPPVKTCANEACGNRFRVQSTAREAIYCSRPCAQAQYQRERRRRVKAAS